MRVLIFQEGSWGPSPPGWCYFRDWDEVGRGEPRGGSRWGWGLVPAEAGGILKPQGLSLKGEAEE